MINTSEHKSEDTVQSGVVEYPIGFNFYFNIDKTPQLLVKIGDEELRFNYNFELSEDQGSVVLRPTQEESLTLEGPEDFSWMSKWDGKDLLIERAIPLVQDSDYQLGRISSEQIERDFDLSVMRDQMLAGKNEELKKHTDNGLATINNRIDEVVADHTTDVGVLDDKITALGNSVYKKSEVYSKGETDSKLSNVYTKAETDTKLSNVYTKAETDTKLSNVYTKAETDAKVSSVYQDVYTKGETDSKLSNVYTKAETDSKLSSVYKVKGSVSTESALPTNPSVGDVYNVLDTGANYVWSSEGFWDKLGDIVDLSGYATKEDLENIDLDGYVKKSGDTMTGDLVMSSDTFDTKAKLTTQGAAGRTTLKVSTVDAENENVSTTFEFERSGALVVRHTGISGENMGSLGTKNVPMKYVYAKYLNSADGDSQLGDRERDLIIPSVGGTLARLEDLEGLGGGDYLPLAGGEMSGPIAFSGTDYSIKYDASKYGLVIYTNATRGFVFSNSGYGKFFPTSDKADLGQATNKWRLVYAKIINNGADLAVPTEGGTLARIEDIDAVVGDISTALTAILGE